MGIQNWGWISHNKLNRCVTNVFLKECQSISLLKLSESLPTFQSWALTRYQDSLSWYLYNIDLDFGETVSPKTQSIQWSYLLVPWIHPTFIFIYVHAFLLPSVLFSIVVNNPHPTKPTLGFKVNLLKQPVFLNSYDTKLILHSQFSSHPGLSMYV